MKKFASLALVIVLLVLAAGRLSFAQSNVLTEIRAEFDHVEELIESAGSVELWERDGLNSRIDQLGIDTVTELNSVGRTLLTDDDLDEITRSSLFDLMEDAVSLALAREKLLERRAAEERATFDKFETSAQADIARTFIEDLMTLRERYLMAVATQLEIRRASGDDTMATAASLRQRTSLIMEQLTGQIRLDSMSLGALSRRLADKPLDEDLATAIALVRAKQSRSLEVLEGIVEVVGALGLDTAEQRGLLIRERGKADIDILEGAVFGILWDEEVQVLRNSIVRHGPDLLLRIVLFALILFGAWLLARVIRYPVRALVNRDRLDISVLLREVIVSVSSVLVLLAGTIFALASAGVSVGPIFAGLGVIGIIIGLAVQDSLGNLAAGVMILIYRPYDVDDHVRIGGAEGTVKRMNLLATSIATLDNQLVVIPNRAISGDTIFNYTAYRTRRVDIKVSFAYAEDPDRVQVVLMDVLENHELVLQKPKPIVHMLAMEDSSVAMMVKPWVRTEDYWQALWDITRMIKKRFDAEGIEIPFPQRVVTLSSNDLRPAALVADDEREVND